MKQKQRRTILDLKPQEARDYLMRSESYCTFDLPQYFDFQRILNVARDILLQDATDSVDKCCKKDVNSTKNKNVKYSNYPKVNYNLLCNKSDLYEWRGLQLIHPLLYVDLVNIITDSNNWETLKTRIRDFKHEEISVAGLPYIPENERSLQSEQITNWMDEVQKQSLEYYLKYDYVAFADISNCYPSLYTHAIAWAVNGEESEKGRFITETNIPKTIGNFIDERIQRMSYNETKGIPQGSVIMDLIAELLLAYIDDRLVKTLAPNLNYHIIRYRDDYRIFSDNQHTAELILKELAKILMRFGWSLNREKTMVSKSSVNHAYKPDKLDAVQSGLKSELRHFQQSVISETAAEELLLRILCFSQRHKNSNQLKSMLLKYRTALEQGKIKNAEALICITTEIAYHAPCAYPQAVALLSTLLQQLPDERKSEWLDSVLGKFKMLPQVDFLEIWLQRLRLKISNKDESPSDVLICQKAQGTNVQLWNSAWLQDDLRKRIEGCPIVNQQFVDDMDFVISQEEVDCFAPSYDE